MTPTTETPTRETYAKETAPMQIAQFQALADAFGADLERWPASARPAAAHLLASETAAKAVLAEVLVFDRLLDRAVDPIATVSAGLLDRITTAATVQAPSGAAAATPVRPTATIVPLPARGAKLQPAAAAVPLHKQPARRFWPVASALAASLALGITIGVHDWTHAPVRGLVEIASASATSADADVDHFVATLHADGIAVAMDEEHL